MQDFVSQKADILLMRKQRPATDEEMATFITALITFATVLSIGIIYLTLQIIANAAATAARVFG